MERISGLFVKFKKLAEKNEVVNKAIINTLTNKFNLKIKNPEATISGKRLILKISGAKKTEVLTQKNSIIKEINKILGYQAVSDISF